MDKIFPIVLLENKPDVRSNNTNFCRTVSFELDIDGLPAAFDLGVTEGKMRLSDLVIPARQISDKIVEIVRKQMSKKGGIIPCRKACSACCSYLVSLSVPESIRLMNDISRKPKHQKRKLFRNCLLHARNIIKHRIPDTLLTDERKDNEGEFRLISAWYRDLNLECPFLSEGSCAIYQHRPLACREHLVTGSPEGCSGKKHKAELVKLPVKMTNVLAELTGRLEKKETEAVIVSLVPPWYHTNQNRDEKKWSSEYIAEKFAEVIKEAVCEETPVRL